MRLLFDRCFLRIEFHEFPYGTIPIVEFNHVARKKMYIYRQECIDIVRQFCLFPRVVCVLVCATESLPLCFVENHWYCYHRGICRWRSFRCDRSLTTTCWFFVPFRLVFNNRSFLVSPFYEHGGSLRILPYNLRDSHIPLDTMYSWVSTLIHV